MVAPLVGRLLLGNRLFGGSDRPAVDLRISATSNIDEIIKSFDLDQRELARAEVRAVNRTADQVRTQAGREIRKEYNVTLRGIRQASRINRARAGSRVARAQLIFSGRPINLFEFSARAQNPWNEPGRSHRNKGGGVTVRIKNRGARKLIEGAFITTIRSGQNAGKKGVFRRTAGDRASIRFLPSLSIPSMVASGAVEKVLLRFSDATLAKNLAHEIKFIGRKR